MAKLSTRQRRKLPKRDFALSGGRYPVNDRAHAIAAKSRASAAYHKGRLTRNQLNHVDARADRVLKRRTRRTRR